VEVDASDKGCLGEGEQPLEGPTSGHGGQRRFCSVLYYYIQLGHATMMGAFNTANAKYLLH
jgi:hypothetical protein